MVSNVVMCLAIYFIAFTDVFSKAYQQQNVTYGRYKAIILLSYVMSALDTLLIVIGVQKFIEGDWIGLSFIVFARGTGAWNGCWVAMWLFNRFHKK